MKDIEDLYNLYKQFPKKFIKSFYNSKTPLLWINEDYNKILKYLLKYHIITEYTLRGPSDSSYNQLQYAQANGSDKQKSKIPDIGHLYLYLKRNSNIDIMNVAPSYNITRQINIVIHCLYDNNYFKRYGKYAGTAAKYVLDKIVRYHINNKN